MPNDSNPIRDYFARLDLESEIADIYLALNTYGPQSLLQLARNAKVERTRLYRLIDILTENNLVEINLEYKRKIYKAAPLSNLQILLAKKEQTVRDLRQELAQLQAMYTPQVLHSPLTNVQFYRGPDGIKQMFWNQTKGRSENLSILFENMQIMSNAAFFERWAERCNQHGLVFRSLVGDHFLQAQRNWYTRHDNQKLRHWQGRYLTDKVFPVTHSTVTYDDVVAYYNWKDGEVFGIEIHNQEIAQAQRNVFEMLWRQGQPIPGHGET